MLCCTLSVSSSTQFRTTLHRIAGNWAMSSKRELKPHWPAVGWNNPDEIECLVTKCVLVVSCNQLYDRRGCLGCFAWQDVHIELLIAYALCCDWTAVWHMRAHYCGIWGHNYCFPPTGNWFPEIMQTSKITWTGPVARTQDTNIIHYYTCTQTAI